MGCQLEAGQHKPVYKRRKVADLALRKCLFERLEQMKTGTTKKGLNISYSILSNDFHKIILFNGRTSYLKLIFLPNLRQIAAINFWCLFYLTKNKTRNNHNMLIISQLTYILGGLAILYLLIAVVLYFTQEKFIFFPAKLSPNYDFSEFENAREVFLNREKGIRLHALYFSAPAPAKGIALFFHGNKDAVNEWAPAAKDLTVLGYDVLMPDYRGYGKSTGTPRKGVLHKDARAFYALILKDFDPTSIIIYGRSLGTGIACRLATKVNAKLLILETPYLSLLAMAKLKMPFFPASLIMNYQMRNDLSIKRIKCPVHIFHGTADELIPYDQALKLASIQGDPLILTTIENGKHSDLTNFSLFHEKLKELLG